MISNITIPLVCTFFSAALAVFTAPGAPSGVMPPVPAETAAMATAESLAPCDCNWGLSWISNCTCGFIFAFGQQTNAACSPTPACADLGNNCTVRVSVTWGTVGATCGGAEHLNFSAGCSGQDLQSLNCPSNMGCDCKDHGGQTLDFTFTCSMCM